MKKAKSSAALIGASGLIGSHILTLLLNDSEYDQITILVRRSTGIVHPKLEEKIVDFSQEEQLYQALLGNSVIFCAVGTTRKKVRGDMKLYHQVDFDIPVRAAHIASNIGCNQFLLVSSVGAHSSSKNFYSRLKGEVEDAISQINIPEILFFQPSILLGKRNEFRLGEIIGQKLATAFRWLIPMMYKPISAEVVATSMVNRSKLNNPGIHRFHYQDMIHP
jgi:uncharacterized protein YbjT (DUF2867 family)